MDNIYYTYIYVHIYGIKIIMNINFILLSVFRVLNIEFPIILTCNNCGYKTHRIFLINPKPPCATIAIGRVFPHGLPAVSHEVIGDARSEPVNLRDVFVHTPKALNCVYVLDLGQAVPELFCCCSTNCSVNK